MASNRHYAKSQGAKVRHPNRVKRQRFPVAAWRFREARLQCALSVDACADLLRISDRTVRNWESGQTRIPYAAYKLLRVLKGGRYLAHPHWREFMVQGPVLVTPEGHRFEAGELGWWSLLVRQARAFRDLLQREQGQQEAPSGRVSARETLGLSLFSTSDTSDPQITHQLAAGGGR